MEEQKKIHTTESETCDRQTDGQTDGIGVAHTRYSIYAVTRKNLRLFMKTDKTRKQ